MPKKIPIIAATSFFDKTRGYFTNVNESKLMIGCLMILMNVGAKYVDFKFSKTQEQVLRNGLARELIIFSAVFMGTRDLVVSVLLTGAFVLLSEVLFHEKSQFCVLPEYMKKLSKVVDTNKDGVVSPEEERRAIEVLEKAEQMRQRGLHANLVNYLDVGI